MSDPSNKEVLINHLLSFDVEQIESLELPKETEEKLEQIAKERGED